MNVWPVFALAGGGAYTYFAGRGILQRFVMRRRGISVGKPAGVTTAIAGLAVFGLVGAGLVAHAAYALGHIGS